MASTSEGRPTRDWSLRYPTVESCRDDWLRMAADYLRKPLTAADHRGLLYRMTTLDRIEIAGDRAMIWKAFDADEPLRDGGRLKASGQSLYRLHRIVEAWKIAGFVGYLPREART